MCSSDLALLLTAPFTPMLFQGEEWGAATPFLYFTGHPDPALGRAVSEGRRQEFAAFGWDPASVPDPQDPATFQRSRLNWSEPSREPHAGLLAWYRELIALRRRLPWVSDPRLATVSTSYDQEADWLMVRHGPVVVAGNLGAGAWTCPVDPAAELLAASDARIERMASGVCLPPDTAAILLDERP